MTGDPAARARAELERAARAHAAAQAAYQRAAADQATPAAAATPRPVPVPGRSLMPRPPRSHKPRTRVGPAPEGHAPDPAATRAVDDYVDRRQRANQLAASSARQTRYLLHSWTRHVADWRAPTEDEILDWVCTPASADGKHRRASALRSFLSWYATRSKVAGHAAAAVPTIAGSTKRPKPIPDRILGPAMARASERDRAAMILGRYAGLRAAEIAKVHVDDLGSDELYVLGKGNR